MLRRTAVIAFAVILTIGISGCSKGNVQNPFQEEESLLDKNWGRSFEAAKHNQTMNPEAGKNTEPVEGLQGAAAEKAMDGYTKGFEQKQQTAPSAWGVSSIQK